MRDPRNPAATNGIIATLTLTRPTGPSAHRSSATQVRLRWVALLAPVALAVSCAQAKRPAYLPPSPPVVDIAMREFAYDYRPPPHAGQMVLRLHNVGKQQHELFFTALPDDMPPLDEQLHGPVRRPLLAIADVRVEPGATDSIAVNLAPGRYGILCLISGPDGVPNSLKGMNSEFRLAE